MREDNLPRANGDGVANVAAEQPLAPNSPGGSPVFSVLSVLLRHHRWILGLGVFSAVAAVVFTQLRAVPDFTATSRFTPVSNAQRPVVSAITLGNPTGESLEFYAELLRSRTLLEAAAQSEYRVARPDERPGVVTGTLQTVVGSAEAVGKLWRGIDVHITPRTGLVTLVTHAPSPELAVALNRRLLDLVNQYNLQQRQSRAGAEREFFEAQAEEARRSLAAAEEDLAAFLKRNRQYQGSPELVLRFNELQRRVDFRQQLYTGLMQAYQQARLDAVRNTPVITVLERPEGSAAPTKRHHLLNALIGLVMGITAGVALAFAFEFLQQQREQHTEQFAELGALARSAFRVRPDRTARPSAKTTVGSNGGGEL